MFTQSEERNITHTVLYIKIFELKNPSTARKINFPTTEVIEREIHFANYSSKRAIIKSSRDIQNLKAN